MRRDNFSKILWQLAISILNRKKLQEEGCVLCWGRSSNVNSTAREGLSEEVKLNHAGRAFQVERHDCRHLGQCLWSARSRHEGKGDIWEVAGWGTAPEGPLNYRGYGGKSLHGLREE